MFTRSSVTVGRAGEISLLEGFLTNCRATGGRAVLVSGEAGIGKSRLAGECARHAAVGGGGGAGTPRRPPPPAPPPRRPPPAPRPRPRRPRG
ncbi:AAA family ATPase, partial [Kitasatospora sp. NPDC059571]|uniref:AAA family ATPase n=1 Tax=Kitasatospora sp. NPDC059571 TaxID=3346871 RepID=UPI003680D9DF